MVPREEHDGFFTAPAARRRCSSIAAGTDHAAGATVGLPVLPFRRAPQAHKQTDSPTCTMPAPGSPAAPQVFSPSPVSMGGALWHGVFLSPVIPAGTLSDSLIDRGRSINARVPALVGAPALLPPSDIGVPTTISTSVYRRSARIDIALNMRSCIHGVWAAPAMRRQAILHPQLDTAQNFLSQRRRFPTTRPRRTPHMVKLYHHKPANSCVTCTPLCCRQ